MLLVWLSIVISQLVSSNEAIQDALTPNIEFRQSICSMLNQAGTRMKIINNKWLQLILILGVLSQTADSVKGIEILALIAAVVILLPFTRSKLGLDHLDYKFRRHQGQTKSSTAKSSNKTNKNDTKSAPVSAPVKAAEASVSADSIPDIEAAMESVDGQIEEFVFDNLGSVVPPDASSTLMVEWENDHVKLVISILTHEGVKKIIDGNNVFLVSNFRTEAIAKAIEKALDLEFNNALAPFGLTLSDVSLVVQFEPAEGW